MTTSWVIINKRTGRQIFETFSKETADEVRENHKETLRAVPIREWLASLNDPSRPTYG